MTHIAMIERTGGPEVIQIVERELLSPGSGEARVRVTAIGLNFIDTYYRTCLYPLPLPSGLGSECAGVVEALGEGVTGVEVGDRVATFGPALGAYAAAYNAPAGTLFKLPDGISDETAAAVMLKGCTAEFLALRCARVQPGWTVLVHAAAGGVGQLLVQWLAHLGCTVIGTVGSDEKIAVAQAAGAAHVIQYRRDDIAPAVRAFTHGAGVHVGLDGVGKATWAASLAATARRGLVVSYGNAGGPVEGVNLATLNQHGSLFVTRPKLYDYYVTPDERAAGAAHLFELVVAGVIRPQIGRRFALSEAAEAHRAIEGAETIGSTLLIP